MSSAYAPAVAARPSAKCRICGHKTARGSRLCSQCGAAVKRARQVPTVMSQFMPVALSGYGSAGGAVAHHQTVRFRNAAPRPAPTRTIGWGALIAFAAFVFAVCVTAYFAALEIEDSPVPAAMPAVVPPVADKASAPALGMSVPPALPSEPTAEPAHADMRPGAEASSLRHESGPATARRTAATNGAPINAMPTIPAGLSMTASDSNADTNPSEGAGAPLPPAPAAVPQEPIVPDRWQSMQEDIARCPRENFFTGALCEQRVRLRYCDGYWGSVPHCWGGVRLDGGR